MSDQSTPKRSPRRKARPKFFQGVVTNEMLALERDGLITSGTEQPPGFSPDYPNAEDWRLIRRILSKNKPPSLQHGAESESSGH